MEPFRETIAAALAAFAVDPVYAVEMADRARQICHKRLAWACRSEVRKAEDEAMKACAAAEAFVCTNTGPVCGVGPGCPFATLEMSGIILDGTAGTRATTAPRTRPQPWQDGSHGLSNAELAVPTLIELRGRQLRAVVIAPAV